MMLKFSFRYTLDLQIMEHGTGSVRNQRSVGKEDWIFKGKQWGKVTREPFLIGFVN